MNARYSMLFFVLIFGSRIVACQLYTDEQLHRLADRGIQSMCAHYFTLAMMDSDDKCIRAKARQVAGFIAHRFPDQLQCAHEKGADPILAIIAEEVRPKRSNQLGVWIKEGI